MFLYYSCHHHVTNTITEILEQVFKIIFSLLNIQWETMQLLYSLEVCYSWNFCHKLWCCIQYVHTPFCRASTRRIHITSLPRQDLKTYVGSQIRKRDMLASLKILKCRSICKLWEVVKSLCRLWFEVLWNCAQCVSVKLRHECRQCEIARKMTSNNFCQLLSMNTVLVGHTNNFMFHKSDR